MKTRTGEGGAARRPPTYDEVRAQQVEDTRQRVLEAVVATLARGVSELSIPAVAREAGVSVPTVYRHFSNKKGLLQAAAERLREERKPPKGPPPPFEDLGPSLEVQFARVLALPEMVAAALSNELIVQLRRSSGDLKERRRNVETVLGARLDHLDAETRRRTIDVVGLLCSSWTARGLKALADLDAPEAAERVVWAVNTLLAGLGDARPAGKKRGKP